MTRLAAAATLLLLCSCDQPAGGEKPPVQSPVQPPVGQSVPAAPATQASPVAQVPESLAGGTPFWQAFRDAKDRSLSEILIDYSYAGFQRCESGIPDVKGPVFQVTDYGAVPDDNHSDEVAIRKAIAAAEKEGGGVVNFPPGRFLVWTDRAQVEPIRVQSSGIVLRGAGSSAGGTVIHAIHSGYETGPYPTPKKPSDFAAVPYLFVFDTPDSLPSRIDGEPLPASVALNGEVKRAGVRVPVSSTAGWRPGDWVALIGRSQELNPQLLADLEADPTWTRLLEGAAINEIHQIREVGANDIIVREPILLNLRPDSDISVKPFVPIEEVGVEDIAFQGNWLSDFVHHRSALDDEGWDAILFDGVVNGWVRRCAFLNLTSGVYLMNSAFCSVIQNRFAGSPGHYNAASRANTTFNLLGLSEDQAGHLHVGSTGNRAAGTVIWRWSLTPTQSIDSHGNGPYATLVDRVDGGTMTVCGGPAQAFPNHMIDLVFWNFRYGGDDTMPINFWEMEKNGVAKYVKPLFVGIHGKPISFVEEALRANESPGQVVEPESLYEAQLALRLGGLPDWVAGVRAEWDKLRSEPLPPFMVSAESRSGIHEEPFLLQELLADLEGLMAGQEQGWNVVVKVEAPAEPIGMVNDYVVLRTALHQMCTYASEYPLRSKIKAGAPTPEIPLQASANESAITITLPIMSSESSRKRQPDVLENAQNLAEACGGTLVIEDNQFQLMLPKK